MKKCNVNENHLYSNHLTQCPWCEIRKATGKDHFPDSTGLQRTTQAPKTKSAQSKSYIPTLTNIIPPTPKTTSATTYTIPPTTKPNQASTPRGTYKVAAFL